MITLWIYLWLFSFKAVEESTFIPVAKLIKMKIDSSVIECNLTKCLWVYLATSLVTFNSLAFFCSVWCGRRIIINPYKSQYNSGTRLMFLWCSFLLVISLSWPWKDHGKVINISYTTNLRPHSVFRSFLC